LAVGLAIAGCAPRDLPSAIGFRQSFLGTVATDEPRAALVARDILTAGGSAGDAAVALAFALTVTYPSSAGLGGGGSCLAFEVRQNRVDAIDFWPRPATAGGAVAVPGFVRGMAALHARYGRLAWPQVLAPAENLARFGDQVSRALAAEWREAGPTVQAAPGVRALFGTAGAVDGTLFRQVDLASVLGQVRARGGGDFYTGPLARRIADAMAQQNGGVGLDDLRGYAAQVGPAPTLRYGFNMMAVSTNPGGNLTRTLATLLTQGRDEKDVSEAQRPHLFVEAVARLRLMGERANLGGYNPAEASDLTALTAAAPAMLPPSVTETRRPGATGFVTVDRDGGAVACVLTMNAPFGTGQIAPGTGMLLAPAGPDPGTDGAAVLVHNANSKLFAYAGAGTGGPAAPGAIFSVAQRAMTFAQPLEAALRQPRLHHVGAPALVQVEPGVVDDVLRGLEQRKHRLARVAVLGRVNAVYCARGLPNTGARLCETGVDPRGAGLAVTADR
jgi:gamma-glutamyltranspeptidase/glutathione hydrolase